MRFRDCKNNCPQLSLLVLIIFGLIIVCVTKNKDKKIKCERDPQDQTKTLSGDNLLNYLSSKRPYIYKDQDKKLKKSLIPYPGCEATKLWYFGRHGTRNPGKKDTLNMERLLPILREKIITAYDKCEGSLSENQFKKLKQWKIPENVGIDSESNLVKQGEKEMKGIGSRYRKRFPALFSPFESPRIQIKSTKSQRTEASAVHFSEGVLGKGEIPEGIIAKPEKNDELLKFYVNCKKWVEEVDQNETSTFELTEFDESLIFNDTLTRVSEKLGFLLSVEELIIIYTKCAFETAWNGGKSSAWCAPFEREDLQAMAYREDLEYFWKDGYGHEINYKQACTPVKNLLGFFSNETETKVRALFSHSGAILKILARLGLFQDKDPLRSDDFQDVKETYKWKTSLIDTMAANLAFVLYQCNNNTKEEVGFFFQEKPMPLPACENEWHCPLEKFEKNILNEIGNCDFNRICNT